MNCPSLNINKALTCFALSPRIPHLKGNYSFGKGIHSRYTMPVVGDFFNPEKASERKGPRRSKVHVMTLSTLREKESVKGEDSIVDLSLIHI